LSGKGLGVTDGLASLRLPREPTALLDPKGGIADDAEAADRAASLPLSILGKERPSILGKESLLQ
jgi:hypothetical protein